MIYLGLEVCYYKQLLNICNEIMRQLEGRIDSVVRQNDIAVIKRKNGFYLFGMGDEAEGDPKDMLEATFQLVSAVREFRKELFGYNFFLQKNDDPRVMNVEAGIQNVMLELFETEGVWIHRGDLELYQNHAVCKVEGDFARIVESRKTEPVYNIISYVPQIRERVIQRLTQFFLSWFTRKPSALLFVNGLSDIAKFEITLSALTAIIGKERCRFLQVFGNHRARLSSYEPFIASMNLTRNDVLKQVPRHLHPREKVLWKMHENALTLLLDGKSVPGDHAEEDFFVVYNLYLTAYFRIMQENFLPGILIFNEPGNLPESASRRFAALLQDLSSRFRLAIILVSAKSRVPGFLSGFRKIRVMIRPFGLREIRKCFTSLYPGLSVPRKVVGAVERLSGGRYGALLHYIYYLRLNKKIVQDGNRFVWVPAKKLRVKIPSHPQTAAMAVIKSLKEEARTILGACYYLAGILSKVEQCAFFSGIGLHMRKVEEQLGYLKSMRLVFEESRPVFYAPLRSFLHRLSPQKMKYLEEQIAEYLRGHARQFIPGRAAVVFPLWAHLQEHDAIISALPEVIHYFIDTRNAVLIEFFLEPFHYLRTERLADEQKKQLEYILFSWRLRFLLLQGKTDEAEKLVTRFSLSTESLVPHPVFARLYLETGRFHLAVLETDKAVPLLKKSMHYFQELNRTAETGESFLELGRSFLARGNLKEALEYFSFSKKMIQDFPAPQIHILSLWFESVTLYLQGNYSHILADCDEAALLAGAHGLKEALVAFTFIKVRVMFDLGFYEKAARLCEEALCLAELYGVLRARQTLFAWRARCACYLGHISHALSLLRALPESDETLFFLGEAYYFLKEDKKAEKTFVKALHLKPGPVNLFAEYFAWESGFALVEGRCLTLNAHGSPLFRLARAFRALLQCRGKSLEEGVAELHALTITEKLSAADPHTHMFYFIYYLVLKTIEKNKTDFAEIGHALTILNKALKHLQERSAFIDEARDRLNYVTQNYWNKFIFDEGKSSKLM